MRLPRLLAVPFVLALPVAASCSGQDDETTDAVSNSIAPTEAAADVATACDDDAPAASASASASASAEFTALYCAQIADVADLYELLSLPVASTTQLELLRRSICTPDAEIPEREESRRSFELFIRGSAQQDPALGERWLEAGVLELFEPTDNDDEVNDGTISVDLEFDDESIGRLADAEQGVFDAVVTDPAAYCAS